MPILTTAALISAGLAAAGATAGSIGSAVNRRKAQEEELRNYQSAKDYLDSMYYRDPLSTVGNRSLLKAARENYEDNLDALNNRMVAGGATMENALAARKSLNEGMDKLYGQLLQGEDARRDRISAQRLQLEDKHSAAVQGGYLQAAQDWNQWGGQMANAALAYGSSSLLDGELSAGEWAKQAPGGDALAGMAARIDNEGNPIMQPIIGSAPKLKKNPIAPGGLAGPGLDLSKSGLTAAANFPWTK